MGDVDLPETGPGGFLLTMEDGGAMRVPDKQVVLVHYGHAIHIA